MKKYLSQSQNTCNDQALKRSDIQTYSHEILIKTGLFYGWKSNRKMVVGRSKMWVCSNWIVKSIKLRHSSERYFGQWHFCLTPSFPPVQKNDSRILPTNACWWKLWYMYYKMKPTFFLKTHFNPYKPLILTFMPESIIKNRFVNFYCRECVSTGAAVADLWDITCCTRWFLGF